MRAVVVCVLVLAIGGVARGERLPVRVFTTADGLANNRVERGAQDAHGFLWFATGEGVSRFDSRQFESFGIADGLPAAEANDVCATSDGRVWVATDAGVAVLDPERVVRPRFRTLTKVPTYSLLVDPSGVVWAGTPRGLQRIEHDVATDVPVPSGVISMAYDPRDRSLWLGTIVGQPKGTVSVANQTFKARCFGNGKAAAGQSCNIVGVVPQTAILIVDPITTDPSTTSG